MVRVITCSGHPSLIFSIKPSNDYILQGLCLIQRRGYEGDKFSLQNITPQPLDAEIHKAYKQQDSEGEMNIIEIMR